MASLQCKAVGNHLCKSLRHLTIPTVPRIDPSARRSESPPSISMTTISCHCRMTQLKLSTSKARACVECCCVDCFQKNHTAAHGPPTPLDLLQRQRAPTLLYFENRMTLARGQAVAFEQLRPESPSINMVCPQCRTVLCVHHTGYQTKVVLVFPDWAAVQDYESSSSPANLRYHIKDWSEHELARLSPLPSLWKDPSNKSGELVGDGHSVRTVNRRIMFQDCPSHDVDGNPYDSFQTLLDKAKHEVTVLDVEWRLRTLRTLRTARHIFWWIPYTNPTTLIITSPTLFRASGECEECRKMTMTKRDAWWWTEVQSFLSDIICWHCFYLPSKWALCVTYCACVLFWYDVSYVRVTGQHQNMCAYATWHSWINWHIRQSIYITVEVYYIPSVYSSPNLDTRKPA